MANTIYGARPTKSPNNPTANYNYGVIGKNSEVFNTYDVVEIDTTNGLKVIASATPSVYGVVLKEQTMASDNQTVAKVKPAVAVVDMDYEYLMGCNSDLSPITSPGGYFKLTGATGAIQVDVAAGEVSTTDRVVICTKVDPAEIGGTGSGSGLRQGLFKFVKISNVRQNT
jgi:hypothetical protein